MKKIYIGALALLVGINLSAQSTVDFESTILPSNSYNNGADLSSGFTYDGIHFSNYYDTTYFYNLGFAISNQTDNLTPGWGNSFSSITGNGYSSANYAIFYPYGNIDLSSTPRELQTMRITNTTYAALSMRDGDFVGKKFGSIYNANGDLDGTNGEDFLKLTIFSINNLGDTLGSVEFYLADFRFADSTLDYIVEDWVELDLSALNAVGETIATLEFEISSSDVGSFGINTPTYFAMDDLKYTNSSAGIAEHHANKLQIFPNPVTDQIKILGASGLIEIFNLKGEKVYEANESKEIIDIRALQSGVYFVSNTHSQGKFTGRFVKL